MDFLHMFGSDRWFVYPIIALAVFFVIREVLTWYWKLNKIVNLLEKIEENTRKTEAPPKN